MVCVQTTSKITLYTNLTLIILNIDKQNSFINIIKLYDTMYKPHQSLQYEIHFLQIDRSYQKSIELLNNYCSLPIHVHRTSFGKSGGRWRSEVSNETFNMAACIIM